MNPSNEQSPEGYFDDSPVDKLDHWSRRRQQLGVIIWSSFLAACLASLLFFAFVDPAQLVEESDPRWWLPSAMAGYAVGFIFFWIICAVAAALTSYLLETTPSNLQSTDNAADHSSISVSQRRS